MWTLGLVGWLFGCTATKTTTAPPIEAPAPAAETTPADAGSTGIDTRRPFPALTRGISYGPFREGQAPGGPSPTAAQILEDLQILDPEWEMIRVYASTGPTEAILRTVRDEGIGLKVMVGAWIDPDDEEANAEQVSELIRLANAYPGVVHAVSVGNESQVDWSAHRSPRDKLIGYLREVRGAVEQPVTTADDYNFWNKPEAQEVAAEVDFLLLHAYAMWNQQSLQDAVAWTDATVTSIRGFHPELPLVIGETGWATELNPEGHEVQYIKAPAGEAEQKQFFEAFSAWAEEKEVPHFYFEAFDEPWKGSDDPREVEKHWGIYHVDRTPKAAAAELP